MKLLLILTAFLVAPKLYAKAIDFNNLIKEQVKTETQLHLSVNENLGPKKAAVPVENTRLNVILEDEITDDLDVASVEPANSKLMVFSKEKTIPVSIQQKQLSRIGDEITAAN